MTGQFFKCLKKDMVLNNQRHDKAQEITKKDTESLCLRWIFLNGKENLLQSLIKNRPIIQKTLFFLAERISILNILHLNTIDIFFFFKDFIYLFLEREEERKKGRETSVCGCPLCTPYWGTWPTTQVCTLTGNETLCFAVQHSIH